MTATQAADEQSGPQFCKRLDCGERKAIHRRLEGFVLPDTLEEYSRVEEQAPEKNAGDKRDEQSSRHRAVLEDTQRQDRFLGLLLMAKQKKQTHQTHRERQQSHAIEPRMQYTSSSDREKRQETRTDK